MTQLDPKIKLAVHEAMVGEVFPSLHTLAARLEGQCIVLEVFVSAELSDDEMDSVTGMEAEILAGFPWAEDVYSEVRLVPVEERVRTAKGYVLFARKTRMD